jgi:hypothetical protein
VISSIWQPDRLEKDRVGAHIGRMKKPWKIIVHVQGVDGKPGSKEYFIVRDTDKQAALATLRRTRPDLLYFLSEVKGEATQDFLDWIQPDKDVFSIMVVA